LFETFCFPDLVVLLEQSTSQFTKYWVIIARPVPLNMVVSYQHPIQCIRFVERQTAGFHNLFVASAGPKIYTYAAETGKQLAIWPEAANAADSTVVGVAPSSEGDEPSAKKRKVSPVPEHTARGAQSETSTAWSTIPILAVSSDGNYVVAVTGEDKCLRVFEIEDSGNLKQLSERYVC
jgi:tRNA (guanine-N(7)-)-methyltransferase subunit TRM82